MFLLPDESATIRVTNLSEDTRESDLQELFRPFGTISRIYLAKDKITGHSKVSSLLDQDPFQHILCQRQDLRPVEGSLYFIKVL